VDLFRRIERELPRYGFFDAARGDRPLLKDWKPLVEVEQTGASCSVMGH
jgi:hypothetical protein